MTKPRSLKLQTFRTSPHIPARIPARRRVKRSLRQLAVQRNRNPWKWNLRSFKNPCQTEKFSWSSSRASSTSTRYSTFSNACEVFPLQHSWAHSTKPLYLPRCLPSHPSTMPCPSRVVRTSVKRIGALLTHSKGSHWRTCSPPLCSSPSSDVGQIYTGHGSCSSSQLCSSTSDPSSVRSPLTSFGSVPEEPSLVRLSHSCLSVHLVSDVLLSRSWGGGTACTSCYLAHYW